MILAIAHYVDLQIYVASYAEKLLKASKSKRTIFCYC